MSKQILVVDDSAAIRTSTTFVLEQEGYTVVQAEDGQDGLAKMESSGPFNLIITDINMPNMDGIEFTKKVRENADWKFIPIVVLTTESQESKMKEGKEAGATGWIVKPFNEEKLLSVVKKLLG